MEDILRPGVAGISFPPPPWTAPAGALPGGSGGSSAAGRSFAAAVSPRFPGGNAFVAPIPLSFANLEGGSVASGEPVGIKMPVLVDGCPTIQLSKEELQMLTKPLELSLVGKFGPGRPKWDVLVRYFRNLHLLGMVNLATLDNRHCLITLSNLDDYTRIFSKGSCRVGGFTMRIFKWTMGFRPNAEPSLVPCWITLPGIGAEMFTQNMLFSIASAVGKPLKVAYATAKGLRGDHARILVEVDLLEEHPTHVNIGEGENCIKQAILMDALPKYCSGCKKIGHVSEECFIIHPELRQDYMAAREARNGRRSGMGAANAAGPEIVGGEDPGLVGEQAKVGVAGEEGPVGAEGRPAVGKEGEVCPSKEISSMEEMVQAEVQEEAVQENGNGDAELGAEERRESDQEFVLQSDQVDQPEPGVVNGESVTQDGMPQGVVFEFKQIDGILNTREWEGPIDASGLELNGEGKEFSQASKLKGGILDEVVAGNQVELEQERSQVNIHSMEGCQVAGKSSVLRSSEGDGIYSRVEAAGLQQSGQKGEGEWAAGLKNGEAFNGFLQDIGGVGVMWSEVKSEGEEGEVGSESEEVKTPAESPRAGRRRSLDDKFSLSEKRNSGRSGRPKKKKKKKEKLERKAEFKNPRVTRSSSRGGSSPPKL